MVVSTLHYQTSYFGGKRTLKFSDHIITFKSYSFLNHFKTWSDKQGKTEETDGHTYDTIQTWKKDHST